MTVDESLGGLRAGPRARGRARLVAARLRLDRVRLPVHRRASTRTGPSRSRSRLLDLGVDEVCFGDTIGVGVPAQVAALTGLAVGGRHPARADRLPLPRHARHGARQRRGRPRRRRPLLRLVDRRDRRLPVRARAPPATSPPRTSSTSSTRRAGSTASSLDGVLDAARFIADALGRPLATKVGQAGGWDPATGARPVAARP